MLDKRAIFLGLILLGLAYGLVPNSLAATLPFRFTLDEDATTSAGIFTSDGTLVRTLWRKVDYAKGTHPGLWDGFSDEQTAAAEGEYSIRVLSHRVDYIWQGAIGNTSAAPFGPTVHRGFAPVRDLVITGTDAFYITGYVEGDFDFRHFSTNDPQRVDDRWCWYLNRQNNQFENHSSTIFCPDWAATDSDGTWVYFLSPDSTDPLTRELHGGPGFIVASEVATHRSANFTRGAPIPNGPANFQDYANGIKLGTHKGLSGIAVEKNGTILAASHLADGKIYLVNKRTGAAIRTIRVPAPGAMAFAPNGDLWVVSGAEIKKIISPATAPVVSSVITQLAQPIDIAIDSSGTFLAIVDGGNSQQIKAFSTAGNPLWTLGQPGGYGTNGPEVTRDKFMFFDREMFVCGNVTFAPDGSFWVNDPGNRRTLHFSPDQQYIEEIMFQNASYSTSVDANNPSRVFSEFLEFAVDYSQPLAQGWKLVRNWGANLPKSYFGFTNGLRQVTILSNGHTYAVVNNSGAPGRELVELTAEGTRLTKIILADSQIQPGKFENLSGNGNIRRGSLFDGSSPNTPGERSLFEEKPLTGFDAQNNPRWGSYSVLASTPAGQKDPVTRCCSLGEPYLPITTSDVILSFDPTINAGWHLGGVRKGGSDWLWKASPSVRNNVPLDGLGSFDIGDGVNYPGNSVFAAGRNVFFGYHGEFWNQSQAGQFMHFYDDGLFIGQFGEPGWGHESFEITVPGLSGNSAFSTVTEVNKKIYLWTNDESQHGPQRWLVSGSENIREASATGTLGQAEPVLVPSPAVSFPTDLQVKTGDSRVSLTWGSVPGATGYNVRMTTARGGAGSLVAGEVTEKGKTINHLVNGTTYYFTASAILPGGESAESHPASATPVNLSKLVDLAGRYDQPGGQPASFTILPENPAASLPALLKLNPLLGNLALSSIGSSGYALFRWNPVTLEDAINLPRGDRIEPQTGWKTSDYLGNSFKVADITGSTSGLFVSEAGGKGLVNITPADDALYYLTIVVPARFRDPSSYRVTLEPLDRSTSGVSYETHDAPGINHIYQFRFRGSVVLSLDRLEGESAIQGIFLDRLETIPQDVSGYSVWESRNFADADPNDPNIGPTGDYDQDGQSNLMEYALGTSPTQTNSARPLLTDFQRIQGTYYLTLQFVRDRSVEDISLRVGASANLGDPARWVWSDLNNPALVLRRLTDVPAKGLETIVVRDVAPAQPGPRFMKLSVSQR